MSNNYDPKVLKDLQLSLTEMLSTITLILDKNQITYCLIGGTALGAKRHNGFIPWDDDIDIGVLEEDIDKIISLQAEFMKKNLFVQHYKTEKSTPYYFTKIRLDNSVFEEKFIENLNIHKGIFVDIFPLRSVAEPGIKNKVHHIIFKSLNAIFSCKATTNSASLYRGILKKLIFISTLFISKKKVYKLLSTRFISKKSNWIGYYGIKNKAFKRVNFEKSKKVHFGKNQYYQLHNVEEYLARYYGPTYNQIPPPNKQINHKPVRLEF